MTIAAAFAGILIVNQPSNSETQTSTVQKKEAVRVKKDILTIHRKTLSIYNIQYYIKYGSFKSVLGLFLQMCDKMAINCMLLELVEVYDGMQDFLPLIKIRIHKE